MSALSFEDFLKVDIRVGTIVRVDLFPEAKKPAYKLQINFGSDLGIKSSSVQATLHYTPDSLLNRQIAAVVNFPPKRIGPFLSEVLVLGVPSSEGGVVLLGVDHPVPDGGRLY